MNEFEQKVEIRWSDLDPNFHVLHSKYYDFAANCRMAFLAKYGLTMPVLMKNQRPDTIQGGSGFQKRDTLRQ